MKRKTKFALAAMLSLAAMTSMEVPSTAHASEPRVIQITAKRFQFTPDQITLKKGETVKLRLVSEDVTHGFFLRPLKIDEEIDPGQATEITVTPDKAGSFSTICDHFCGANHGNMKMTIVVTE